MYLAKDAPRNRIREAQKARDNRAEVVKARSHGQITRRDLFRWGLFTTSGLLLYKNGFSPYAPSAYGQVPTGTPRSPLFGAKKFSQPMPRLDVQKPSKLTHVVETGGCKFDDLPSEYQARGTSYHTDFTADPTNALYRNPLTNRGPCEGRPPGPIFAHQRWDEYLPKVGYVMSIGSVATNTVRFHPSFPWQQPNSVWSYGAGKFAKGKMPAPLIKARYGEPIAMRVYNNMPISREDNNGFGRNETQLHFHNAHNGAESDGAANVHHFPGTFYDYRWSTTLARADMAPYSAGTDARASGPDGNGGLVKVRGDFREIQGTLWAHDHRFFFTAENVYKGNFMMVNMYSGPDRGNEALSDGVNLKLPSGKKLDWGNIDFDVNLIVSDAATDQQGQLFFDIFDTDGFLGDLPLVNSAYAPFFEVMPRPYRFRILNASMSRFYKLAFSWNGNAVPFKFIANDGNLVVNPIQLTQLDEQGSAERYDVVIDFSQFRVGDKVYLVNLLKQTDGRKPSKVLSLAEALKGDADDPVAGPIMEFRVVGSMKSVDDPAAPAYTATGVARDRLIVPPNVLTAQIPLVAPVRERVVEFGRSGTGDSRGADGQCNPDCPEFATFPWTIKINGQAAHSMNANRISLLIPKPGEVEHWTYINGGGGWDHPIHLHFEEGVTIDRGSASIPSTEKLVRKDVWRLRPSGRVKFQVQFGEFGGSYVNHCHNTVHEDFAMLMRIQLLTGQTGSPQAAVTCTPIPSEDGCLQCTTPEILKEGDPRTPQSVTSTTTPTNG